MRAPRRLRHRLRLWVAAGEKAAVKGRWAGVPDGTAGLVTLMDAARSARADCHPERRRLAPSSSWAQAAKPPESKDLTGCGRPQRRRRFRTGRRAAQSSRARAAAALRSTCHPERRARSARSRRISPVAKACGNGGPSPVGVRAALPGRVDSAGEGFRPAERRQSRAGGHICPSGPPALSS